MRYIGSLITIGILILVKILFRIFGRKNTKIKPFVVSDFIKWPKYYLYSGIFVLVVFVSGGIYACIDDALGFGIFFILLGLLSGSWIILLQVNWEIKLGKTEFTYRNFFRIKKTYKYDEVVVKNYAAIAKFYVNKKHIVTISHIQDNSLALGHAINSYKKEQRIKAKESDSKVKTSD